MIDPNKGTSLDVLRRLRDASYEQYKVQLMTAIEQLLADFEMTWDDLATKLEDCWWARGLKGRTVKTMVVGDVPSFNDEMLNDIAAAFSTVPYVIFRPREPWIPER